MAQAYKCDRCGVLYEPYEPYVDDKLMYNGHCVFMELSPHGNIELCKSCQKQLISFLHGQYDEQKAIIERKLLAHVVYTKLKPMFETNVLDDKIDLRDNFGLQIIFSKDYSTSSPRLIMETTKFHKSGKTEMIARDCFGMDCGLDVVADAVASMIRVRLNHIKEGESDDDTNA